MPSHCLCASQGFVSALVHCLPSPEPGLTSGHAKGFVGVVEILPAHDFRHHDAHASRHEPSDRVVMRGAAPNRQRAGSIDQSDAGSMAIACEAAS
jgi:hypothetical protein